MGKTALIEALKRFDLPTVRTILHKRPDLRALQLGKGFNLLQFCARRPTVGDRAAATRQLRLAQWLVSEGFDPRVIYTTQPGEDGEEDAAEVSLAFFAVAGAQNNQLARYFLDQGATPHAVFAAVWWGNSEILADLVAHGANVNQVVGATPLHMAVDLLERGAEGKPAVARRRMDTLRELLRLGADPNIAASNGTTPLHSILEKGYDVNAFALLLARGANPDVPGRDGRTVRQIAARKRDTRYANALTG